MTTLVNFGPIIYVTGKAGIDAAIELMNGIREDEQRLVEDFWIIFIELKLAGDQIEIVFSGEKVALGDEGARGQLKFFAKRSPR